MGTYNKAVEYIVKRKELGREPDMPMLPAIIMNPSGDFSLEETSGKMLWRFPYLASGLASQIFDTIYQDENVRITVIKSRIKGDIECIVLPSSYYEFLDIKMHFNLVFGGLERYVTPSGFNSFIILPSEVYDFEYTNDVTHEDYTIHIADTSEKLIKTTNRNEVIYPQTLNPRLRFTSMTDGSSRYGGADKMPEWRLNCNLEYEVEIPTHILIQTDYLPKYINMELRCGMCYSTNTQFNMQIPPEYRFLDDSWIRVDTTPDNNGIIVPGLRTIEKKPSEVFNTRYFHTITQAEVDSTSNILIELPEQITNKDLLLVYSRTGELSYGQQYELVYGGLAILLYRDNVVIEPGDILELYVYKFIPKQEL